MKILVTGGMGFIGTELCTKLLHKGHEVHAVDLDPITQISKHGDKNYSEKLRTARLNGLIKHKRFDFTYMDLSRPTTADVVINNSFDAVVHLAGLPGVAHSIEDPEQYTVDNISAFEIVARRCGTLGIPLIYASSSSVYGGSKQFGRPTPEHEATEPLSYYGATKLCDEVIAGTYSKMFKTNMVGLRFFTVYGTLGRPDMAIWKFAEACLDGKEVTIVNDGKSSRDITMVDDAVLGIVLSIKYALNHKESRQLVSEVFNIGSGQSISVRKMLETIQGYLGNPSKVNNEIRASYDAEHTLADISKAKRLLGYSPYWNFSKGLRDFCKWYYFYRKGEHLTTEKDL